MTVVGVPLLRPVASYMHWNMVPLNQNSNDQMAILNPEARFKLYPITSLNNETFYQPRTGWLETSVKTVERSVGSYVIALTIHKNTLQGVDTVDMMSARGSVSFVSENIICFCMVSGLDFDARSLVEWITFEKFDRLNT